jgi:Zn-dependent alcohol dehydrogenase
MASDYSPRFVGGVATGLTADSGSVQAGATLLDKGINVVATVGTIGDSCILPADAGQKAQIIVKNTATNSMDVFPNVGATIDGASANAAEAIAGGAGAIFVQVGTDGLTWITV